MMADDRDLAEVSMLTRRAGLTLDTSVMAKLLAADRRTRPLIDALRASLESTDEPAVTFDAHHD